MGTEYPSENSSRKLFVNNISDPAPVTPSNGSIDVSSDISLHSSSMSMVSRRPATDDTNERNRFPVLTQQELDAAFGVGVFVREKSIIEKTSGSDIKKGTYYFSRGRGRPSVTLDEARPGNDNYNYGVGFLDFRNFAFPSMDTFTNVLEDSKCGRKKEQVKLLLNGKHASISSSYKFMISPINIKESNENNSKTLEMLNIVATESLEVYKNLMIKLLEKCTMYRQYQIIYWSKILQPKNQLYEIKGYALKLWPIFSYSCNIEYCGPKDVQMSPKLEFAVVFEESLLEMIETNYNSMGVSIEMKGQLIMSAFSKDVLVIEKIHMDRNSFGMFDPTGNGDYMTYGDYYTTKYGLGWKSYKIWQPIVECKKFINSEDADSGPSMFHLPEFCFRYWRPSNIRLNEKFVVALENAYQTCYENSNELLQIFIHVMEQSNAVKKEMKQWGIQFHKEGSGN